jgi:hypothetical protein
VPLPTSSAATLLAWGARVLGIARLPGLAQNFLQFGVASTVTRFPITAIIFRPR